MNSHNNFLDFLAENNVDRDKAKKIINSFSLKMKLKLAAINTKLYGVNYVPAFIVGGKYMTSPSLAGSNARVFKVIEHLIEKVRQSK